MRDMIEAPPLAEYKNIADYAPQYADFVVRCTWFRSYFGVINNFDKIEGIVSIVFEGTPKLLFTLRSEEITRAELLFRLDDIKSNRKGSWSICQYHHGKSIWYI